ncbi:MAG: hypothetical protein JRI68_27960 [Deltaproteobacteria bacterium]|nr:hypothetical protein [Deltaproteobacteria bacterium]
MIALSKTGPLGPLVLALALGGAAGCSYTSEYKPPADGRARGVWKDDGLVMVAPAELPRCAHEVPPRPSGYHYAVPLDGAGYYAPHHHHHHHSPVVVGVVVVGPPPLLAPVPIGPGGLGGSMDGESGKVMLVVMAIGAIVAFPFIAMGLALGHPEDEDEVAANVDRINEYNDEARERLSMCYETMPLPGPLPQPQPGGQR